MTSLTLPGTLRVLTPLWAALWLAGCASTALPSPEQALPRLPATFSQTQPAGLGEGGARWTVAPGAEAQPRGAWWLDFMDPVLTDLVQRADLANTRLQEAAARLAEARALLGTAEAARAPQVGVNAGLNRQAGRGTLTGEQPSTTASLGLGASYELDVMGRLRQASQAAGQDARAQAALLQSTRLLVQADVAQTYLQLRSVQAEQGLVDESLQALRDMLALTTRRERAGDVAELDLARARSEVAATESEALALQRQQALLTHALAVLVGEVATGFNLPEAGPLASIPVVPPGVPGTVLARRPDVAAAQASVLAAQARLGVAQTAWFPAVTLTGSAGQASPELGDLFKWSARAWSAGALLSLPLFDGGRREAAVQGAQARHGLVRVALPAWLCEPDRAAGRAPCRAAQPPCRVAGAHRPGRGHGGPGARPGRRLGRRPRRSGGPRGRSRRGPGPASEPVGRGGHHGAALAIEAVATGQAGGDLHLVAQVHGVQGQAPVALVVGHHRVQQGARRRAQAVGAIPRLAQVAHAQAGRQAAAALAGKAVHQPQRGAVLGHARQALALVGPGAAAHAGIGPGVAAGPVPVAVQAGRHLQLGPAHPGLADLQAVERVRRVAGLAVGVAQVVHRRIGRDAAPRRLPLHPRLPLLAALGLVGAAIRIHPAQGQERLRIAQVGGPAAFGQVVQAGALAPGLVVDGGGRAALGVGLGAVVAQAQGQAPTLPGDLVLGVQAQLALRHRRLAGESGRGGVVAVDRLVDIDVARLAAARPLPGLVALQVQAQQPAVADGAALPTALGLVVEQHHAPGVELLHQVAGQGPVVGVEDRAGRAPGGRVG